MSASTQSTGRPWDDLPAAGPLLTPRLAARYLGRSKSTYYRLAAEGALPRPINVRGIIGVPQPWLDAIIAEAVR